MASFPKIIWHKITSHKIGKDITSALQIEPAYIVQHRRHVFMFHVKQHFKNHKT